MIVQIRRSRAPHCPPPSSCARNPSGSASTAICHLPSAICRFHPRRTVPPRRPHTTGPRIDHLGLAVPRTTAPDTELAPTTAARERHSIVMRLPTGRTLSFEDASVPTPPTLPPRPQPSLQPAPPPRRAHRNPVCHAHHRRTALHKPGPLIVVHLGQRHSAVCEHVVAPAVTKPNDPRRCQFPTSVRRLPAKTSSAYHGHRRCPSP